MTPYIVVEQYQYCFFGVKASEIGEVAHCVVVGGRKESLMIGIFSSLLRPQIGVT
jgi:hypothetical protein